MEREQVSKTFGRTWGQANRQNMVVEGIWHELIQKYRIYKFRRNPKPSGTVQNDFDTQRIITTLQIQAQKLITPTDTLIVFDEIQSAEKGITSLKYFCENAPQYYIVAAGSLLGMGLHSNISFPVGKVDFLDLRPMSFTEFLIAINEIGLADTIKKKEWEVISIFHKKLSEYLRYYLYVGGMPEVVSVFAQTRDWDLVRKTQFQRITYDPISLMAFLAIMNCLLA